MTTIMVRIPLAVVFVVVVVVLVVLLEVVKGCILRLLGCFAVLVTDFSTVPSSVNDDDDDDFDDDFDSFRNETCITI